MVGIALKAIAIVLSLLLPLWRCLLGRNCFQDRNKDICVEKVDYSHVKQTSSFL